jgi:hypothetical protein
LPTTRHLDGLYDTQWPPPLLLQATGSSRGSTYYGSLPTRLSGSSFRSPIIGYSAVLDDSLVGKEGSDKLNRPAAASAAATVPQFNRPSRPPAAWHCLGDIIVQFGVPQEQR